MIVLGPLVIVVIAAVIYALTRTPRGGRSLVPGQVGGAPGVRAPRTPDAAHATPGLAADLSRWVAAGLLSARQSEAILSHERTGASVASAIPLPGGKPDSRRRTSVVAEALGYLGGMLATIGLGLIVARYWPDRATAARLAISGGGALALLGGGALVREGTDPALTRLRWFLWLASTATTALFAGVVLVDGLDVASETVVLGCSVAVAVQSGLLWWWRERPLQQLTCIGGVTVAAGAMVAQVSTGGPVGITVWLVGSGLLLLGLRRLTPSPLLTEATGAIAAVVGSVMVASTWQAPGLVLLNLTAFSLLAVAVVPRLAPDRADQLVTGVVGCVTLVQAVPGTLGYFSQEAGVVTGLATCAVGGALVLLGARRLVRVPILTELLGGAAIIGGAALTGVQAPGFAPVFGIATAIGLVALGMLPGQVLLSVFGSLGLLINVPWAIGRFFPGEGRAPLLILVSGALILSLAVVLARSGGRFRRELGGPSGGIPPTIGPPRHA